MKKRILLAIAALMLCGLTIVAFAYTNTSTSNKATMDCCCKGDSCPMKSKDAAGKETASCCEKEDCCCKAGAESCPMKGKDAAGKETASCCPKDGADSCPMKGRGEGKSADKAKPSCCDKEDTAAPKKDGEAAKAIDMKNVVVASSTEGCCCSCCGAKKDS